MRLPATWLFGGVPALSRLHTVSSALTMPEVFPARLHASGLLTEGFEQWRGILVAALVLLLAYQQWRLFRFRLHLAKREELFRIVAENAADMIALVDTKGRRLYNSPAYEKVLGYSARELADTPALEQVHPEDRFKVLDAARQAHSTGVGKVSDRSAYQENSEQARQMQKQIPVRLPLVASSSGSLRAGPRLHRIARGRAILLRSK